MVEVVMAAAWPAAVVAVGVTSWLVSQADIDKVTTVKNKHYPEEVYAKFSAAEKAKHWQLRNQGKRNVAPVLPVARRPESVRPTCPTLILPIPLLCWLFLGFLTQPSALPAKRGPMMFPPTHPTAKTLPWFARPRSPNTLTDPLPLAYLPFEPFAWQLNLDVIVLTLVLK